MTYGGDMCIDHTGNDDGGHSNSVGNLAEHWPGRTKSWGGNILSGETVNDDRSNQIQQCV